MMTHDLRLNENMYEEISLNKKYHYKIIKLLMSTE
jgi:hypothetical protein